MQQTYENLPTSSEQNIYEPITPYLSSEGKQSDCNSNQVRSERIAALGSERVDRSSDRVGEPGERTSSDRVVGSEERTPERLGGPERTQGVVKDTVTNINQTGGQHTKDKRKAPANINTAAFDNVSFFTFLFVIQNLYPDVNSKHEAPHHITNFRIVAVRTTTMCYNVGSSQRLVTSLRPYDGWVYVPQQSRKSRQKSSYSVIALSGRCYH